MSKHTPGPWTLLPARTLMNVKGANGEQVCQLPIDRPADAALIAAAPELLEALQALLEGRPTKEPPRGGAPHRNWVLFEKARDAIAKATE